MKKIKLPNPMVMVCAGLGAFGIADIINPCFNSIGVMILLLIPVVVFDLLYPQQEMQLVDANSRENSIITTPPPEVQSDEVVQPENS
jgi:hypothetical protein